ASLLPLSLHNWPKPPSTSVKVAYEHHISRIPRQHISGTNKAELLELLALLPSALLRKQARHTVPHPKASKRGRSSSIQGSLLLDASKFSMAHNQRAQPGNGIAVLGFKPKQPISSRSCPERIILSPQSDLNCFHSCRKQSCRNKKTKLPVDQYI